MQAESIITINLLHVYVIAKIAGSIALTKWESKYPVFDAGSCNSRKRKPHEIARRWLYHLLCNPEMGLLKLLPFPYLWLRDGNAAWKSCLPIEIQQPRPIAAQIRAEVNCRLCQDTGIWRMSMDGRTCESPCSCQVRKMWENRCQPKPVLEPVSCQRLFDQAVAETNKHRDASGWPLTPTVAEINKHREAELRAARASECRAYLSDWWGSEKHQQ